MRDVLIHNYHEADLDIVWTVVDESLPKLLAQLKPLIHDHEDNGSSPISH